MTRFPIATQANLFASLIYRKNRHVTGKKLAKNTFKKHFHHHYNPHGMTRFPIATQNNLFAALISRKTRHVTSETGEKYF
jgi:hypothetical protein